MQWKKFSCKNTVDDITLYLADGYCFCDDDDIFIYDKINVWKL